MEFKWLLCCAMIVCIHGGSGQPYIFTTSRGYTSTETGDPFFECYRAFPDRDARVYGGRYVKTYNGEANLANVDPPSGTQLRLAYRIDLITANHRSYGVFYCSAYLDGERSVVPTIFLRSDAKFVPTNGRLSKTVNNGDVDVRVDFREIQPTVGNKMWRFNGTTVGSDSFSPGKPLQRSTVYTIPEVNTSYAGVYEIHLGGERNLARAGLLRLIVRACPAGHYDVSGGCTRICQSCYNGGICHDETGICICPPGFMGESCEIACGGNRYGRDCEYRCDYEPGDDKTACSGLQVCVPDPYGCSCTPGYKGLECTTECDRGEFGASCTEICQCVSRECDRFTGVCTGNSTACEPGWTGENCQGDVPRTPSSTVTGIIISVITVFSIIVIAILIFKRRKSPDTLPSKADNERKPYDDTQSPETAHHGYQDLYHEYERVSNDGTAYQELQLTLVQWGHTRQYVNTAEHKYVNTEKY